MNMEQKMSDKTINEVLVLMKVIRERIKDLKELRLKNIC